MTALDHPQMRTHSHGGEPLGQGYAFTSGGDHQRREDGPLVVCMPRRLALFLPVNLAGRGRHRTRPSFQFKSAPVGVSPPARVARQGVEPSPMHFRLRSAASHSYSRPVGLCLDARNGRVLSDRKRSALPVNSSQHTASKLVNAAKVVHLLNRLSSRAASDAPTDRGRHLAPCSLNRGMRLPR